MIWRYTDEVLKAALVANAPRSAKKIVSKYRGLNILTQRAGHHPALLLLVESQYTIPAADKARWRQRSHLEEAKAILNLIQ
jgi:hypothetical protein